MEQRVPLSSIDDSIALEKGRLLAAQNLARDPVRRQMCEEKFGVDYCKAKWPEVYAPSPFFKRLIDRITFRPR